MGSRKTPSSKDLSPFHAHFPRESRPLLTSSPQITGCWGFCFCFLEGEGWVVTVCRWQFVPSHRMTRLYCFHSLNPPLQWLSFHAGFRQDVTDFFFLDSLFLPFGWVFICHSPTGQLRDSLEPTLYLITSLMGDPSWNHMPTVVENN